MKWAYSKLYHAIKGEKCNTNGNFEENIDLSEHISERLRKIAVLEKIRLTSESSHSGSSDYAASTLSPVKIEIYMTHTKQVSLEIKPQK